MFADDFVLTPKLKNEILQAEDLIHDCEFLEKMAKMKRLRFAPTKTVYMRLSLERDLKKRYKRLGTMHIIKN